MKEWYLSKTPNVTFVYLSKWNIKLPGLFGNSKKRFLWTGLVITLEALNGSSYWKATRLQALIEGRSILKYFCFSAGWLWTTIKLPSPMIDAANGFDPVLYLKILTHNSVFLAKPDGRWAEVDTRTIFRHFCSVPSQVSQVILPLINSCYCLCTCDCLCNCRSICLIVLLVRWSPLIILKNYWKVYKSLGDKFPSVTKSHVSRLFLPKQFKTQNYVQIGWWTKFVRRILDPPHNFPPQLRGSSTARHRLVR